jgi:HK97 family phage major capsid protein
MPFGHNCEYETFDDCVRDQSKNHDADSARRICGALQRDTEGKCNKGGKAGMANQKLVLEEKRASIEAQMEGLVAGETLSDEDRDKFDALQKEHQQIAGDLKRLEAVAQLEKKEATKIEPSNNGGIKLGPPRHEKDPMHGFADDHEFLLKVMQAGITGHVDERLMPLRAAVGSDEQSGVADEFGGYAVPTSMIGGLLTVGREIDPTQGRTRFIPMQTPVVELLARTDKNHTTSVSGGITVTRRPETVSPTASRMQMEKISLRATTQMALTYSTRELLSDSPLSFAALVDGAQRDEMASEMLKERISGTGVGEPEGVLNSPALVSLTRAAAGNNIDGADVIAMRARSWRYSQCIWMANHDCLPNLAEAHVAGTNSDVFFFQPARGEDIPDMLLGRPIFFSEYMPTVALAGSIALVNWGEYLTGTYQPVQGESSIHVRFVNHEETFKLWMRNDGRGWWRTALTPNKGANTLSPFVTLAAA